VAAGSWVKVFGGAFGFEPETLFVCPAAEMDMTMNSKSAKQQPTFGPYFWIRAGLAYDMDASFRA
jgi:hypothetical protein